MKLQLTGTRQQEGPDDRTPFPQSQPHSPPQAAAAAGAAAADGASRQQGHGYVSCPHTAVVPPPCQQYIYIYAPHRDRKKPPLINLSPIKHSLPRPAAGRGYGPLRAAALAGGRVELPEPARRDHDCQGRLGMFDWSEMRACSGVTGSRVSSHRSGARSVGLYRGVGWRGGQSRWY
jgi:hypothetical protein